MPNLVLQAPTFVTRTGATKTWVGTSSGTYTPGDKSYYRKYQILPDSPFSYLPTAVVALIDATYTPVANGTWIIDDTVAIGSSTTPGTSIATNSPVSGAHNYGFGTPFSVLSDLNAGNYYLWISYRADPTSYSGSVGVSPASPINVSGGSSASSSPTFSISATPAVGNYLVVNVTVTSLAEGTVTGPGFYSGTGSVNNGQGVSDSGGIQSGTADPYPPNRSATGVTKYLIVTGSPQQISPTASSTLSVASSAVAHVRHTVSTAVVTPDATTVTINSILLTGQAPPAGGGGFGGAISTGTLGPIQDEQEMTTAYIDDLMTFYAQTTQYSTGTATDATGSPAFRVYEEATNMSALNGSMTLLDSSNTDGLYYGQLTLSAANGFEVGKCYCVRVAATVDAIAQGGIVERFVVRANPATATTTAAAVWSYADPGDTAGRATTTGGLLAQLWRYCFNRNQQAGAAQTVYRDDSTTTMLSATFSATDTAANKGKSS